MNITFTPRKSITLVSIRFQGFKTSTKDSNWKAIAGPPFKANDEETPSNLSP